MNGKTKLMTRADGVVLSYSDKELGVLKLLAAGLPYAAISEKLQISRSTITTYQARAAEAAGAHNRNALACWLLLVGLVTFDDIWSIWKENAPMLAAWQEKPGPQSPAKPKI